jgi:hypothetical protein
MLCTTCTVYYANDLSCHFMVVIAFGVIGVTPGVWEK